MSSEPVSLELPENAPQPRLCHIVKWKDFDGYGFNLHGDKNKPGQYIGKIDQNSPAETAGLKEGDRIVEVNGVNISNENHKQVVERIRTNENETKLLVIDGDGDKWYKEHNIIIKSEQSNVIFGTSKKLDEPEVKENGNFEDVKLNDNDDDVKENGNVDDVKENGSLDVKENGDASEIKENGSINGNEELNGNATEETQSVASASSADETKQSKKSISVESSPQLSSRDEDNENANTHQNENDAVKEESRVENTEIHDQVDNSNSSEEKENNKDNSTPTITEDNNVSAKDKTGLNLNMTAAQMRAQLSQKKKVDPRNDHIDLKKKYQIIQNM